MDVKEAVVTAKTYIADLFDEEGITDISLEEVVLDELSGDWKVTSRLYPPREPASSQGAAILVRPLNRLNRSYKVVRIKESDGSVISVTDRLLAERPD